MTDTLAPAEGAARPTPHRLREGPGDRVFTYAMVVAGVSVLGLIVAITAFLLSQAWPALRQAGGSFFTQPQWFPDADPPQFGIAALVVGTLISSAVALLLAVPVGVAASLCVVELLPRRVGRLIGQMVDLLASVPSVVYGLWGFSVLVPWLVPLQRGLDRAVGGVVPLLHSPSGTYGRSIFAAAVVLAIMVLPTIAALCRETFLQVPRAHREAALALGATRWEMIRTAVLPATRPGVIAASMLGLGRALGETIAVAMVLSASFDLSWHLVEPGGVTIAANIAAKFGEAGMLGRNALVASGLVLFALTLAVNAVARLVVRRSVVAGR
jgi:phosphate transport system permease protein